MIVGIHIGNSLTLLSFGDVRSKEIFSYVKGTEKRIPYNTEYKIGQKLKTHILLKRTKLTQNEKVEYKKLSNLMESGIINTL